MHNSLFIIDRLAAINRKHPLYNYQRMYVYYFTIIQVYPIFTSFPRIGRENPLESFILLVNLKQNQMFVMKLVGPAHTLSNFVRYELLNH